MKLSTHKFATDLLSISGIRRLVKLPYFQFLLVAPALLIFLIAAASIFFGVDHPGFNFGMVLTWVVWWGTLIALFVILGRGWCLMCPFGALGEWVQRLSLWWRRKWGLGFYIKYPRRLQNLWLAIAFFIIFIFLDNGYGISNSPRLTAGLIIVLFLGPVWVDLLFDRRTFCLYHCPLTAFIGMCSMFAPFEIRRKSAQACRQCRTKACINGSEQAYGCPMMLRHCDFTVNELGYPRCHAACPAGVDSDGYVNLIAHGKFKEALELHRKTMPFAGVCGRVCTHPCEVACERGRADGPVSIRALKRFMADYELKPDERKVTPVKRTKRDKVAVVGSGPAGLACAYDLVRQGYAVTVFEAAPEAGGLLRYGIPDYRQPEEILDYELNYVKELGVEIKTNTSINNLGTIFAQGYKAVFLAIGAGVSQRLGLPGEDTDGVIHALDFLRQTKLGEKIDLGEQVAIIGGGNAAIHAARMAWRLGAREVTVVYQRSRAEMPAIRSEVAQAEKEGVKLQLLTAPIGFLHKEGRLSGIRCTRMQLGQPDTEFLLEVDSVVLAIGQTVNGGMLTHELERTEQGTLKVDPITLQTSMKGVFAGGDGVTGLGSVILAIAAGKEAAISIDRYLGGQELTKGRAVRVWEPDTNQDDEVKPRDVIPRLALEKRKSLDEVEFGLDEETAVEEARRCWNCAYSPSIEGVDRNRDCILCTECIKACPYNNLKMGLRWWGRDLWARASGRLDESVAATTVVGLVTTVSLFLVLFLTPTKSVLSTVLPPGTPPNDWPRIVSAGLLYLGGVAGTLVLLYGFSYLSKLFSGVRGISTKTFFINFGYAGIPLGIMKFISDILDHVLRTWGAIFDVVRALLQDFPLNRVIPAEVTVKQLLTANQTYLLQVVLISIGFGFSLYITKKLAGRMFLDKDVAFRAFLPIATFIFILGMAALWALSAAL